MNIFENYSEEGFVKCPILSNNFTVGCDSLTDMDVVVLCPGIAIKLTG